MEAKGPSHGYAYLRVICGVHGHLSDYFCDAAAVCGDSDLLHYPEACHGTGTKLDTFGPNSCGFTLSTPCLAPPLLLIDNRGYLEQVSRH